MAGGRFYGAVPPLTIYALQLVLNAAWTPLFFGLHRPDLGVLDIVLVWFSIIATIAVFYPIHAGAALLLLLYLAWSPLPPRAQLRNLAHQSFVGGVKLMC